MKLPDFHNSELSNIRKKYWIKLNNYFNIIKWEKWIIDEKLLELREKWGFLIKSSEDIQIWKDKTLEYLWDKIIVYIYDWVSNFQRFLNKPSVHFYECTKIIEMKSNNKFDNRYIWSNNNYNWEYKILLSEWKETLEKLNICWFCKNNAKSDWLVDTELLDSPFYLNKYFDYYSYYKNIKFNPKYNFMTIPKNQYPKNWEEISKIEREKVKYICQKCLKDCKSDKLNLHVHHKDHNKWNNFTDNFEVLCFNCHAKHHSHMR